MAGPITWRNVGGGGGNIGALLNGGQNQINGAADGLLRTLDQFRKQNVSNAGLIRADNTQNFLDQVAAVGGAEQLANPEVQAQLEQARLGYGNAIDRDAARGAVAARLAALQTQSVNTQKYNDVQEEVSQRPVLEDLAAKMYSGDIAGYNQVLAEKNLRDEAGLRKQLMAYTDDVTNQGYRANAEQRAVGSEQRAIGSYNLSQEVGKENLANSRQERKYRDDTREVALAGEAIKLVTEESAGELAAKQTGNVFATGSTDVNKDSQTILKNAGLVDGEFDTWLGSNDSDRQKIQKGVTSMLSDGVTLKRDGKDVKIPIPPAMLEQYLASTKGEIYITASPEKDMQNYFTNMFKDNPEMAARAFEGKAAKDKHNDVLKQLKKFDKDLRLSKNPKLSSTLANIETLRGKTAITAAPLPGPEEDLKY